MNSNSQKDTGLIRFYFHLVSLLLNNIFKEFVHFIQVVKFISMKLFLSSPYCPFYGCRVCYNILSLIVDIGTFWFWAFFLLKFGLLILLIISENQHLVCQFLSLFVFYFIDFYSYYYFLLILLSSICTYFMVI